MTIPSTSQATPLSFAYHFQRSSQWARAAVQSLSPECALLSATPRPSDKTLNSSPGSASAGRVWIPRFGNCRLCVRRQAPGTELTLPPSHPRSAEYRRARKKQCPINQATRAMTTRATNPTTPLPFFPDSRPLASKRLESPLRCKSGQARAKKPPNIAQPAMMDKMAAYRRHRGRHAVPHRAQMRLPNAWKPEALNSPLVTWVLGQ